MQMHTQAILCIKFTEGSGSAEAMTGSIEGRVL